MDVIELRLKSYGQVSQVSLQANQSVAMAQKKDNGRIAYTASRPVCVI